MKNDDLLYVPMLERKWRPLSFLFFPLPVVIVIVLALLQVGLSPDNAAEIIYGSWAVGFTLLNLTKEKIEDEMVKTFRLQAFQTGFFWLMCGLVAIMVVNYLRFEDIRQEIFSAPLVLFLLNGYVFAAFEYQKWKASKEL
ncbi:hypothetical protein [Aquiflexum gelatinilyticum]|uniref:Uncharacterized protein n=1 Tax=Aquiflexum gelatinilyticum TaxID=2961943 RepID=A0A9X2P1R6_9BACT|nr:hypothetical protein [Aquiflexum gelatinilyticum]MCR9014049.1 hypothetical protein [Aquiflexum gelatinilyticum]